MATKIRIDLSTIRASLSPRREPYWVKLTTGKYIGFRRLVDGGTWIARFRRENGKQAYESLGDVTKEFGYDEAIEAAEAWFQVVARKDDLAGSDGPAEDMVVETVEDACRCYVKSLLENPDKGEGPAHDADMRFRRAIYGDPDDVAAKKASRKLRSSDKNPRQVHSRHRIASIKLERLTTKQLLTWRNSLNGAPASINRTLTSLKAALNLCVTNGDIGPDKAKVWKKVPPRTLNHDEGRRQLFLDLDQRRALLANASGSVRDLIEAAMLTGARPGELVKAKRSQFDTRTGLMTLVSNKGKDGKPRPRTVPLSPPALALFKRLTARNTPDAPIFTRDDGTPWQHSDWDEQVRAAANKAELPEGVCLYTLRHCFITTALVSGVMSTLQVARLVGTSLPMIEKHYGHLVHTAAKKSLAMMEMV